MGTIQRFPYWFKLRGKFPLFNITGRDGKRPQGAVVPLEGEFLSGVMRGAFHPQDGQLYAVGLDGWGDYSTRDGCFQRVRYLGGKVRNQLGLRLMKMVSGLISQLNWMSKQLQDTSNFFAQQWNYEYGKRYGSPEFSVNHPESLGHDPLAVRSVQLLENKNQFSWKCLT